MNVIALDWDGVMESPRTYLYGSADPVAINAVNSLLRRGWRILFTSVTRTHYENLAAFIDAMRKKHNWSLCSENFVHPWKTDPNMRRRHLEIQAWLSRMREPVTMIVIDDEGCQQDYPFGLHLKCSTYDGLTFAALSDIHHICFPEDPLTTACLDARASANRLLEEVDVIGDVNACASRVFRKAGLPFTPIIGIRFDSATYTRSLVWEHESVLRTYDAASAACVASLLKQRLEE